MSLVFKPNRIFGVGERLCNFVLRIAAQTTRMHHRDHVAPRARASGIAFESTCRTCRRDMRVDTGIVVGSERDPRERDLAPTFSGPAAKRDPSHLRSDALRLLVATRRREEHAQSKERRQLAIILRGF